jgi:L-seryl-tRNA(Ser) seleniumtransferase
LPEWAVVAACRSILRNARDEAELLVSRGADANAFAKFAETPWAVRVAARASELVSPHPKRVINATGVILHTNLGRAPIAAGAAQAAVDASVGYSNLELDLATGRRGHRLSAVAEKLCVLSGAPAATAVNNCAAAVLLTLDTLARGREVVVSRGELVEIGGSFRVPAIMERAGVKLVEVGTTNRTHPRDYAEAIGPDTALLLKVHRSNFEQTGFVTDVELAELVEIGREHGLPVLEDLGAGTLLDLGDRGVPRDVYAPGRIALGADVVCFSGDKLVGGPQAGIILGSEEKIAAIKRNPLARALRLDKMTLAALDWTLGRMLDGSAQADVPLLSMMLEGVPSLEARAQQLRERVAPLARAGVRVGIEKGHVPIGGGSLPGVEFESRALVVSGEGPEWSADEIMRRLRENDPPVLARVRDDAVCFDLRTLQAEDVEAVACALENALR